LDALKFSTETKLGCVRALRKTRVVVDIGQIGPDARRMLQRLERAGEVRRGTYFGFPISKPCWIAPATFAVSYRQAA
jgi:hypothetical protein